MENEFASMEPVTVPSKALKGAFEALDTQVDTVRIDPREDGWHMYGLSPDKTSMVNVHLPDKAFDPYGQWPAFAIDTAVMLEMLAKAKGPAVLDISKGYLSVTAGRMTMRRAVLPDFEEYPRMLSADKGLEVCLCVDMLVELLTSVSEKEGRHHGVTFTLTDGMLELETYEDDDPLKGTVLRVPRADCVLMAGEGSARYSHRILREILGAVPKGTDVDVQYGQDYVMNISYSVEGAYVVYAVAPWIGEE